MSNAGVGGKKQVSGFNMGSKFQFKSTKWVYKHVFKKKCTTTSGIKNNTETTSKEESCSNPFDALRSAENDDVLGANRSSYIRAETDVDEGNKPDAEPIHILISMPNDVILVNEVQLANKEPTFNMADIGDEDSDDKVEDVFNIFCGIQE
jgi:hypothetical protein